MFDLDPTMANVLRNNMCQNKLANAKTFKHCLNQEFIAWADENIEGCKNSHIEKLVSTVENTHNITGFLLVHYFKFYLRNIKSTIW